MDSSKEERTDHTAEHPRLPTAHPPNDVHRVYPWSADFGLRRPTSILYQRSDQIDNRYLGPIIMEDPSEDEKFFILFAVINRDGKEIRAWYEPQMIGGTPSQQVNDDGLQITRQQSPDIAAVLRTQMPSEYAQKPTLGDQSIAELDVVNNLVPYVNGAWESYKQYITGEDAFKYFRQDLSAFCMGHYKDHPARTLSKIQDWSISAYNTLHLPVYCKPIEQPKAKRSRSGSRASETVTHEDDPISETDAHASSETTSSRSTGRPKDKTSLQQCISEREALMGDLRARIQKVEEKLGDTAADEDLRAIAALNRSLLS